MLVCSSCNKPGIPDKKYCMFCGGELIEKADIRQSATVGTVGLPQGELPLCPICHQFRLTWQKEPIPTWVWVICVIGVFTIAFLIGFVLWAYSIWWMLKARKVEPYCPVCKKFFSLDSIR